MKITFITENNFHGIPPKTSCGRTDLNWMYLQQAYHQPINNLTQTGFDIGVYIVPKKNPDLSADTLNRLRKVCSKLGVMQEASNDNWQDYPVETQIEYLQFLSKVDFIMCHNDIDEKYFKGLFPSKPIFINPTVMVTDILDEGQLTSEHLRADVMMGGTLCKWYNGFDSYVLAAELSDTIFAPGMGRMTDYESYLDEIQYIPYSDWKTWMYNLSKVKYAVHMMRTAAAGSFSLNCAWLGIPCVGWDTINTQRLCFPELTFEVGDMESARKKIKHLKTNQQFYDHVSAYSKKMASELFSESVYLTHIKENYEKLLQKP